MGKSETETGRSAISTGCESREEAPRRPDGSLSTKTNERERRLDARKASIHPPIPAILLLFRITRENLSGNFFQHASSAALRCERSTAPMNYWTSELLNLTVSLTRARRRLTLHGNSNDETIPTPGAGDSQSFKWALSDRVLLFIWPHGRLSRSIVRENRFSGFRKNRARFLEE